jgi:hypothetical protein
MHKNAMKCNETLSKWCKNKHEASKIIDTFEMYHLQIAGSSSLSAIGLTKKLLLVPGLVADWKQSSARGGARTALTLAKAHYPELDLDLITSGIPESSEDGAPVDKAAIQQSVLGYDQLCALGTQLNLYYEAYDLPGSPSQASALVSAATAGADGGDDVTSAVPPF